MNISQESDEDCISTVVEVNGHAVEFTQNSQDAQSQSEQAESEQVDEEPTPAPAPVKKHKSASNKDKHAPHRGSPRVSAQKTKK